MKTDPQLLIRPFLSLRHPISGLSHLVGACLALIGLFWLLHVPNSSGEVGEQNGTLRMISALVFGISMVLLYSSSSLYHLLDLSDKAMRRLRQLDHSMVYIFIAGTCTPVLLVPLESTRGSLYCIVIWALAILGVLIKIFWVESSRWLRVSLYLAMSWLTVIPLPELVRALPFQGSAWFVAGGLAYTSGSVIYALKRPNPFPSVFGFHEIWHLFVLLGSFCHYWAIKQYILQ